MIRMTFVAAVALVAAFANGTARADSLGHSGRAAAHSGAASAHGSAAVVKGAAGLVAVPLMSAGGIGQVSGAAGNALWDAATRPLEITRDLPLLRPAADADNVVEPSPAAVAR